MEIITSRKNETVQYLKKLSSSASFRREEKRFVGDGSKLLEEALRHGAQVETVLYCDRAPEVPEGIKLLQVSREILETVSSQKTPQSVFFSCRLPDREPVIPKGRCLVLENVQDPGNVGTVLRTASAFCVDTVVLVGGCADLYNPKTLRAGMGAVFRQRVAETDLNGLRDFVNQGNALYGAALSDKSRDIRRVDFTHASAAVGSEGRGLSQELLSICTEQIIIPMRPDCESLNAAAAAAVILWQMMLSGGEESCLS